MCTRWPAWVGSRQFPRTARLEMTQPAEENTILADSYDNIVSGLAMDLTGVHPSGPDNPVAHAGFA